MNDKNYNYSYKQGDRFGRLVVISYTDRVGKKGEYKCLCDCGKITYPKTWALKSGRSKSCGCLMKNLASTRFKLPENLGFINELYRNYKSSAEKRKYDFELDIQTFRNLIDSECYYCGDIGSMQPYGFHKSINYNYNGIDRIDNKFGYIEGNVVACCKICNNAKSTLSIKDFKIWISKINKNINNF